MNLISDKRPDFGTELTRVESLFCCFLKLWPQANCLISLNFLIWINQVSIFTQLDVASIKCFTKHLVQAWHMFDMQIIFYTLLFLVCSQIVSTLLAFSLCCWHCQHLIFMLHYRLPISLQLFEKYFLACIISQPPSHPPSYHWDSS